MTLPAFVLSVLFVGFYGSLYHAVRGGRGARWLLYLFLSGCGFAAGHWLAAARGWHFLQLGPIELGLATVGSYAFLGVGDWLSRAIVPGDEV